MSLCDYTYTLDGSWGGWWMVVGWLEGSWGGWICGGVGDLRVHWVDSSRVVGWRIHGVGGGRVGGWRVHGVGACVVVLVVVGCMVGWVVGEFTGG